MGGSCVSDQQHYLCLLCSYTFVLSGRELHTLDQGISDVLVLAGDVWSPGV
jgi:hypothetical protein